MVPDARGITVDARLSAGQSLWAIGDVTGIWPLTHVGKYQARIVAANILGEPRESFDGDELALDAEQPLDDALGLLVASFAEVVIADDAVRVDEVQRRPVAVREGTPDLVVVVDRDWIV